MSRGSRATSYKRRQRDVPYMLWVKTLLCCARGLSRCEGAIEADHAGRRSIGRKAPDRTCIPLCQLHHTQRSSFSGPFRKWTQHVMREWLAESIDECHAMFRLRVMVDAPRKGCPDD